MPASKVPAVASEFAEAVVERDFPRAYSLTTDGLRSRMSLEEFTRTLEEAEVDVVAPGVFDCDTNPLNAESLWATFAREGKPLPADIDPKSFRQ
jgi:hypothetical protein